MDSPKPFSSHGRPPSTKYVFGKVNLLGVVKELPKPQTTTLSVEVKRQDRPTVSSSDHVDLSNQRFGQSRDQPVRSPGLPSTSNSQLVAKDAPPNIPSNVASVADSVSEKIDKLKTILGENKKRKIVDEVWKQKQPAINTARIATENNQLAVVEAERRRATILQTQSSLLAQIVADTQQKLRDESIKEVQDDVATKYEEIASQHKAEIKAELIKDLTPEVKAVLRTELEGQVKRDLYTEAENSITIREEVKRQLSIELAPTVKAELRLQLTDQMRREVFAQFDATTSAQQAKMMPQLIRDMAPKIEAAVRRECQEQMRQEAYANWNATMYELQDKVKDSLYRELEPSVKASLREALQDAVWVELRDELHPTAMREIEEETKVYEIGLRHNLELELTAKIRTELKDNLRRSVELELRQEIKDAWANEGNGTLQQPCTNPSDDDERRRALSRGEGSYPSQLKTASSPEEHGQRLQSPAQSPKHCSERNDYPGHLNSDNLRLSQEQHSIHRTKRDHHLSYSAYQHMVQDYEDECSQAQHQIGLRSSQYQSYDMRQEHAKQQAEHLREEKFSQLQYDDDRGSSEQGFSSVAKEHPQDNQSVGCYNQEGSFNPVGGSSKKRHRSFDGHDDDHYGNKYHDSKRRRSEGDGFQYREPRHYLPGEVLGMSQPKVLASSPPHSMKPPPDTLEREVEDIYGPGPMRQQDYDQFTGRGAEEETGDYYANSEDGVEGFDEDEPDLATDSSESGLDDEENEFYGQDELLQRQIVATITMDQEKKDRAISGCSVDDPITLGSSDDENYSTEDEQWDEERTLVEEFGEVGGKEYLAKEEEEEEEEEEL